MNICVFGLWHLGTVIAACMARKGFNVIGLDFDEDNVSKLNNGHLPVYEPGLEELLKNNIENKNLYFTSDPAEALKNADVLWISFDTPVDEDDRADVDFVEERILSVIGLLREDAKVVISSQVPVGFTGSIEKICADRFPDNNIIFACSPENLRLGKAIQVFENPDRIVIGVRKPEHIDALKHIFLPVSDRLEWMSTESAEMTKHAINAFLATSVVFANEIASLCEYVGANAKEVERGLKSEERIGPKAYLGPGAAFAGGTLARDINFLINIGQTYNAQTGFFKAIKESNNYHKSWIKRKCEEYMEDMKGRKIAVLGLTYKPGTNTLRRSWAVELCEWLYERGAVIKAFDPNIESLPDNLNKIVLLGTSIQETIKDTDCIVIATEHPVFRELDRNIIQSMKNKIMIDANGFLEKIVSQYKDIRYCAVGRKTNESGKT